MAVLLTLLFSAGAAILVRQIDGFARAQSARHLFDAARMTSSIIDGELRRDIGVLETLSKTDAVLRRDWRAVDRIARRLDLGTDAWITVGDRHGHQLVNTRLPEGSLLPRGMPPPDVWRELDTGRPRACNLGRGLVEKTIVCVDLPIMERGKAAYHLTMVFRPERLARLFALEDGSRYTTIVDRKGVVIWRNRDAHKYIGQPVRRFIRAPIARSPDGTATAQSLDGVATRAAFSRSPYSGWTFVLSTPLKNIDAPSMDMLRLGLQIAAFLLFVAVLVAGYMAHRVQRAIGQLSLAAQRIGIGEKPDFQSSGITEIDAVGATLDRAIAERAASEERFRFAQDIGDIGAWDWDIVRDEGHVSPSFKEMHGLSHIGGLLTTAQVRGSIHPDDLAEYDAGLASAHRRKDASTHIYRVIRGDGSIRHIAVRGRVMFDAQGQLVRAVGIVRDVTVEREAEAELRRLNTLLEERVEQRTIERDRLWEISSDPFVISDRAGVWLAASPAWTHLLGWTEEELIGRTSEWIEHPDDRMKNQMAAASLADATRTHRFETRMRDREGKYHWISWTAELAGEHVYSISRDITAEREQAEALAKAEESLRQAQKMESIGHITGGVAHDFNNLLAPIVGALDLLQQRGSLDERSQRLVGGAAEAAERARLLVQRLLAFARRQPLRRTSVDVSALAKTMTDLIASTLGPRIAFSIDAAEQLPPALADANQLEMALLNIAVNARDAMPDGGAFTITISEEIVTGEHRAGLKSGAYVRLRCVDTGVGMPDSVIKRAVEPFFSTKGTGRGTGLGLSMVHGLAAQLGGGMQIESDLGAGTAISLWLPLSDERTDEVETSPAARLIVQQQGTAFLIDDEQLVRTTTSEMLASLGYRVIEAADANEALSLLTEGKIPDVIVTDHLMPGTTGTELIRQVRTLYGTIPSLIISGYADLQDIAPDLPRLAKPFTTYELARALAELSPKIVH